MSSESKISFIPYQCINCGSPEPQFTQDYYKCSICESTFFSTTYNEFIKTYSTTSCYKQLMQKAIKSNNFGNAGEYAKAALELNKKDFVANFCQSLTDIKHPDYEPYKDFLKNFTPNNYSHLDFEMVLSIIESIYRSCDHPFIMTFMSKLDLGGKLSFWTNKFLELKKIELKRKTNSPELFLCYDVEDTTTVKDIVAYLEKNDVYCFDYRRDCDSSYRDISKRFDYYINQVEKYPIFIYFISSVSIYMENGIRQQIDKAISLNKVLINVHISKNTSENLEILHTTFKNVDTKSLNLIQRPNTYSNLLKIILSLRDTPNYKKLTSGFDLKNWFRKVFSFVKRKLATIELSKLEKFDKDRQPIKKPQKPLSKSKIAALGCSFLIIIVIFCIAIGYRLRDDSLILSNLQVISVDNVEQLSTKSKVIVSISTNSLDKSFIEKLTWGSVEVTYNIYLWINGELIGEPTTHTIKKNFSFIAFSNLTFSFTHTFGERRTYFLEILINDVIFEINGQNGILLYSGVD